MNKVEIYKAARAAFDAKIATSSVLKSKADGLTDVQQLQVRLANWVNRELTSDTITDTLGISEEVGETIDSMILLMLLASRSGKISHTILKHYQGIREHHQQDPEKLRAEVADGIIDTIIYAMNLCTHLRLDFDTLMRLTIDDVTGRRWKTNPEGKDY